jgi:hypothetical protein
LAAWEYIDRNPLVHLHVNKPRDDDFRHLIKVLHVYNGVEVDPFWIVARRDEELRRRKSPRDHYPQFIKGPFY